MAKTIVEIDELKQVVQGMPKNSMRIVRQPEDIPNTLKTTNDVVDYVKSLPAYSKYFDHKKIVKTAWVEGKLIWIILEADDDGYSDIELADNPFDLDFDE